MHHNESFASTSIMHAHPYYHIVYLKCTRTCIHLLKYSFGEIILYTGWPKKMHVLKFSNCNNMNAWALYWITWDVNPRGVKCRVYWKTRYSLIYIILTIFVKYNIFCFKKELKINSLLYYKRKIAKQITWKNWKNSIMFNIV